MSTPSGKPTRKESKRYFWKNIKDGEKKKSAMASFLSHTVSTPRKRVRVEYDNSRFEMLPMCGHEVKLPEGMKPYPTQKLMMTRILSSLNGRHNVLAESPTGSGKTLALLASTTAWLVKYRKQREEARTNCPIHGAGDKELFQVSVTPEDRLSSTLTSTPTSASKTFQSTYDSNVIDLTLEDDQIPHDFSELPAQTQKSIDVDGFTTIPHTYDAELETDFVGSPAPSKLIFQRVNSFTTPGSADSPLSEKKPAKPSPAQCSCLPRVRIYYGTRTHKQIGQVVKEFARLPYAGVVSHTILASRDQSCINETARNALDITACCKELITVGGIGCKYKENMRGNRLDTPKGMRQHVENYAPIVFDMEDLVEALKTSRPAVCPYFTSTRVLTQDADIIFCPFSYLVDPIIRNSSDVTLKNSIVILDEAHNIEDVCRESASFTFHEKEIADSLNSFKTKEREVHAQLEGLAQESGGEMMEDSANAGERMDRMMQYSRSYSILVKFVNTLWDWFVEMARPVCETRPNNNIRTQTRTWAYLHASLAESRAGRNLYTPAGSNDYQTLADAYHFVLSRDESSAQTASGKADAVEFRPSGTAIVLVEKWLYFQEYFGKEDYQRTYKVNITIESLFARNSFATQTQSFATPSETRRDGQGPKNSAYNSACESTWLDSHTGPAGLKPVMDGHKTSVALWCMSPALTFMGAFEEARSVILASGTLCPVETLTTELGMDFKTQMEGQQVIPKDRIFATVLPRGPSNTQMNITYSALNNDPGIYKEIVHTIHNVCQSVPNGILVFFTSYKMITSVLDTMRSMGMDRVIGQRKVILEEPRRSSDLNSVMSSFDDVIENPQKYGAGVDGAVMLAVFRGKISEGIDFADDRARAVISVGIPFPSLMDAQVKEKRAYNDEFCKTMNILSGENWYVTQAYRALNQALGRCLRHKNDWGALIMIDDRLVKQKTGTTSTSARVSKWIREQLNIYANYQQFEKTLQRYVAQMTAEDEERRRSRAIAAASEVEVKKAPIVIE